MKRAGGLADPEATQAAEARIQRSSGDKSWFWLAPLLREQPIRRPANSSAEHCVPAASAAPFSSPASPPFRPVLQNWFFLGGAEIMEADTSSSEAAVEPASIERILASGGSNNPMQPPPAERVGSVAAPTAAEKRRSASFLEDTAPKHDSAIEISDDLRKTNRVSVSFPVQPLSLGMEHAPPGARRASPSPLFDPTFAFPTPSARVSSSTQSSPTDNGFLTALAAQERRVLELKEELHRAEQELGKLKGEWAAQENAKKRQNAHRIQPLQTLNADLGSGPDDDADGSSTWIQKEVEKRKSLLTGSKPTHRRVFSGSRHTRALSLLSPDKMNHKPLQSPAKTEQIQSPATSSPPGLVPVTRLNTAPDLLEQLKITNTMDDVTSPVPDTSKEAFRISRQMATDFKEGLWTFFEDLRQATVGEEGVAGPPPRPNKPSTKPHSHQSRSAESPNEVHKRTSLRPHYSYNAPNRPARPLSMVDPSPKAISQSSPDRPRPAVSRTQSTEFWNKEPLKQSSSATPHAKVGLRKKSLGFGKDTQQTNSDVEEPWDTWDTPEKRATPLASSSNTSQASATPTSTAATSPTSASEASAASGRSAKETPEGTRTQKADSAKRDPIPWPALQKLTPGNLKRTASNLMSEWEKSLTPPPERKGSREDYLSWPSPMNP
ncbi:MAG: hypothetical protein M1821_002154 [Bathelium mastoideum]|nr:MAG: hypothetical protein M1821_002154 [Bathelium mastoideum]